MTRDSGKRIDDPRFVVHAPSAKRPREKFRDFHFGPLSLHRFFAALYYLAAIAGLYYVQDLLLPRLSVRATPDRAHVLDGPLWTLFGVVWLLPLAACATAIVGNLCFRHNTRLDDVPPMSHGVVFRIVSRGVNAECLLSTIRRCQLEMRATPLFPYLIEVVTDGDTFDPPRDADIRHVHVPAGYVTPRGTLFKARALHYACEHSDLPGDAWVLHLDEESHITPSVIKGVAAAVARCERTGDVRRVGQGTLLYHRSWGTHPFLTLADMRRTGDDIGTFFLQHTLGWTIVGLHGSFVLARHDVVQELGFDVGPDGSVTEDAWWILLALERGVRPMWVDGYVEEQSTQSVSDFLRQRRRWSVGLVKTAILSPVAFRFRALFVASTMVSLLSPLVVALQLVYQMLCFVYEQPIAPGTRLCMSVVQAAAFAIYLFGLVPNMREHGTPVWRMPVWVVLAVVLMPLFFVMELTAMVMAFVTLLRDNANEFYVVKKSAMDVAHVESYPLCAPATSAMEEGCAIPSAKYGSIVESAILEK